MRFIVCAFVLFGLIAVQADAAPTLRLTDNLGNTVTVTDNGVGDTNATVGVVSFSGSLGGLSPFTVNVTTGLTVPVIGQTNFPRLDLNSVNVTTTGAGTLTIEFSVDGLLNSGAVQGFVASIGGVVANTVELDTYYDAGNALFAQTTQLHDIGPLGPGPFSASASTPFIPAAGPYSLTEVATLVHTEAGQISSFDAELNATPEPGTFALLGVALAGFALARRRRNAA